MTENVKNKEVAVQINSGTQRTTNKYHAQKAKLQKNQ